MRKDLRFPSEGADAFLHYGLKCELIMTIPPLSITVNFHIVSSLCAFQRIARSLLWPQCITCLMEARSSETTKSTGGADASI